MDEARIKWSLAVGRMEYAIRHLWDEGYLGDGGISMPSLPEDRKIINSSKEDNDEELAGEMARVLVVDDEKNIRLALGLSIRKAGYEVHTTESVTKAMSLMEKHEFDVVLADILMPDGSGMELLKHAREKSPDTQVIMLTGKPEASTADEAMRAGAFDYLVKPVNRKKILETVAKAIEMKALDL